MPILNIALPSALCSAMPVQYTGIKHIRGTPCSALPVFASNQGCTRERVQSKQQKQLCLILNAWFLQSHATVLTCFPLCHSCTLLHLTRSLQFFHALHPVLQVEKAKIALIQFCISPPKTDLENNVIISDYSQMDRCERVLWCV